MNFQRLKYAISTGNFYLTRTCSFFPQILQKRWHSKAKSLYGLSVCSVYYFCKLNIERARAVQCSLIFFIIHTVLQIILGVLTKATQVTMYTYCLLKCLLYFLELVLIHFLRVTVKGDVVKRRTLLR